MTTWTDGKNRKWSIELTLAMADRVLERTKVDLLPDDYDYRDFITLAGRPRQLADVLWECSRKEAEEEGVSREEFAEGLGDKNFAAGWEALHDAIMLFSSGQPAHRLILESFEAQMRGMVAGVEVVIETIKSNSTNEALREAVADIEADLRKSLKAEMKKEVRKALDNSAGS
jgi:hypothetical protein